MHVLSDPSRHPQRGQEQAPFDSGVCVRRHFPHGHCVRAGVHGRVRTIVCEECHEERRGPHPHRREEVRGAQQVLSGLVHGCEPGLRHPHHPARSRAASRNRACHPAHYLRRASFQRRASTSRRSRLPAIRKRRRNFFSCRSRSFRAAGT